MKRSMLVLCLVVILSFAMYGVALASLTPPPPDEKSDADILSTTYLCDWSCELANNGDGTVKLIGFSQADRIVDKIYVELYLQKWTGSSWVTVSNASRNTEYNDFYVDHYKNITVQKGYYYRTISYHQVTHDGLIDPSPAKMCTSSSLLIK